MSVEDRILEMLRKNGPMRASYIGNELWNENDRIIKGRKFSKNLPQRFARPAGKILNRMKIKGLVWFDADLKWRVK